MTDMTAEERAQAAIWDAEVPGSLGPMPSSKFFGWAWKQCRDAIREAEAAARKAERWETIEEVLAWTDWASYPELVKELRRALAESEKP